jgi:hypothetical protein
MLEACRMYLLLMDKPIQLKDIDPIAHFPKKPEKNNFKKPSFDSLTKHLGIVKGNYDSPTFWKKYKMNPLTKNLLRETIILGQTEEPMLPVKNKINAIIEQKRNQSFSP